MQYNTQRTKLILPEYGRNIQEMVNVCLSIADREERTQCACFIVSVMANMFPEFASKSDNNRKLWDHLNLISGFKLDVDFPCEVLTREEANPRPERIPYGSAPIRYRHYGRNIEQMINRVADMEEGEQKEKLISMIAHHMKKLMFIHNKEGVDDAKVLRDLAEYSGGRIDLDPNTYLLHEFKEVNQTSGNNKKTGKRKKK